MRRNPLMKRSRTQEASTGSRGGPTQVRPQCLGCAGRGGRLPQVSGLNLDPCLAAPQLLVLRAVPLACVSPSALAHLASHLCAWLYLSTRVPGLSVSLSCRLPGTRVDSRAHRSRVTALRRCVLPAFPLLAVTLLFLLFFLASWQLVTGSDAYSLSLFALLKCELSFPEHLERGWVPKAFLTLWSLRFCVCFLFLFFWCSVKNTWQVTFFIIVIEFHYCDRTDRPHVNPLEVYSLAVFSVFRCSSPLSNVRN